MPARDLAPRMFSLLAGWGLPTFSGFWWLVPVLGAHLGGLAGVSAKQHFWHHVYTIVSDSTGIVVPGAGRAERYQGLPRPGRGLGSGELDLQSVVCTVPQYSPLRARDCEAPGSPAQKR